MFELVENGERRFLTVHHFGTVSADEIGQARKTAIAMCEKTNTNRIMVDLREAVLDWSVADALSLADSGASSVPKHIKSAVLKQQDQPGHHTTLTF